MTTDIWAECPIPVWLAEQQTGPVGGASKYARLAAVLATKSAMVVELTFTEVDQLVPDGLPDSAYRYRTWWTSSAGHSAQSRHGWISVGYRVSRVDLANGVVVFTNYP